jgi:hypothetical protein
MQIVDVDVALPADELLRAYQGNIQTVLVRARDGRRIQFPVKILWSYIGHEGIYGRFRITYDGTGKFQNIVRIE